MNELRTTRLLLRRWCAADREPLAALNADPEVMRFFPAPLTRAQSAAFAARVDEHFAEHGFGLWAVEVVGGPSFAGFVGLAVPAFDAHFTPCVEIGWRLARQCWGRGYASEAARRVLRAAFEEIALDEVASFTVPDNLASRRVMAAIGMTHDPADDFDHPGLPASHPLRRHVLYRARRDGAAS